MCVFFFKQKTAYEMRISDWSSDVCSSDLIREFGKPMVGASLAEIIETMEQSPKPVVAAIDGHALGGGLEVALGAHFRVAAARAKIGLPEVNLGLLPGGGGTQRGTRLMGPENALDLILSGRHVPAKRGQEQIGRAHV